MTDQNLEGAKDEACAAPSPISAPRVLMVASEIYPLAKTGGLADVCGALPKALAALGADVRLLMPGYPEALAQAIDLQLEDEFEEAGESLRLWRGRTPDGGLSVWLVDCPRLYGRPGTLYQDLQGQDWPDNFRRFALLSQVGLRVALGQTQSGWRPDLVHCHDWHVGLLPLLLHASVGPRPATLFTIHNAAFQGNFALQEAADWGVQPQYLTPTGAEFYGQFSCLKAGIRYADVVTTVSPNYARELLTPEFGCGMEGLLQERAGSFLGIMNGIDFDIWNPSGDRHLPSAYSRPDCGGKTRCKVELQRSLGLQENASAPLAISASRITTQKMADVLLASVPQIMSRHSQLQLAVLGRGERALEEAFVALANLYPGRLVVRIGYEEPLAHRMHAGADLLLHGSRFEPCGLAQLYAMRYGTVPVVRRVGGLADSVIDVDAGPAHCSTGFVFDEVSPHAMQAAVHRGVQMYETRREDWYALQRNAMAADFGWRRSATQYLQLYRRLLGPQLPRERVRPADDRRVRTRAVSIQVAA